MALHDSAANANSPKTGVRQKEIQIIEGNQVEEHNDNRANAWYRYTEFCMNN